VREVQSRVAGKRDLAGFSEGDGCSGLFASLLHEKDPLGPGLVRADRDRSQ
jgi:hypothetical protein